MNNKYGTIHLLCGKVCSGKSTFAKMLHQKNNGVILSCDDLMLSIFDEHLGDNHDTVANRCKEYLYKLATNIATSGIDVILDFGFWSKLERSTIKNRFNSLKIPTTLHYIYIDDYTLEQHISKRNSEHTRYFIDENILKKCNNLFEPPTPEELSE